jgi:hypothetical protein
MSMACRTTTAIIDPAVRMNSTSFGVFFSVLEPSLVHIPILSSPSVQATVVGPSATQHCQGDFTLIMSLSKQSPQAEKKPTALSRHGLLTYMRAMDI